MIRYSWVRTCLRLALDVFFRRCDVVGSSQLPAELPLLLIANHVNGLVDPFLLIVLSHRPLRIVAKHTLWRIPVMRSFLNALGAIPVHRPREDAEAQRRNQAFFETCVGVLERGEALAIFPEGTSHDAPAPLPLRTGAARIVLAARERGAWPAVVPVGLNYDEKERFRSDLAVVIGPSVSLEGLPPGEEGVRALTQRFAEALAGVVVGLASWEEHRLLEMLVDLADPEAEGAASSRRRLAFARAYATLRESHAVELAELRADLEQLATRCREVGIAPERLKYRYTRANVARYALPRLEALVLGLPLGMWGLLNSYVPYRAVGFLARRLSKTPDQSAMIKVLASIVLFPLFYLVQSVAVAALLGIWPALAYAALLAPSGYYALRYWELGGGFGEQALAFFRLLARRKELRRLRRQRREILARVDALAERFAARIASPGAASGGR